MLTPALEKLILCGKASFNTFTIGGSEKTILNVTNDRYIIITDITISHHLDNRSIELNDTQLIDFFNKHSLTQLQIFSDRSYNHFVYRNEFMIVEKGNNSFHVIPSGQTKFDTYLIHNTDVSFSWVKSFNQTNARSVTPAVSVGRPVPFDYGKEGQNSLGVVRTNTLNTVLPWRINQGGTATQTNNTQTNELQFPVTDETVLVNFAESYQYPIANINYVEIFGELTNISATL
jgi:hypothetical protein